MRPLQVIVFNLSKQQLKMLLLWLAHPTGFSPDRRGRPEYTAMHLILLIPRILTGCQPLKAAE